MINLQTELDRIHALEWDKQQGELEALAVRLAEERDQYAAQLDYVTDYRD